MAISRLSPVASPPPLASATADAAEVSVMDSRVRFRSALWRAAGCRVWRDRTLNPHESARATRVVGCGRLMNGLRGRRSRIHCWRPRAAAVRRLDPTPIRRATPVVGQRASPADSANRGCRSSRLTPAPPNSPIQKLPSRQDLAPSRPQRLNRRCPCLIAVCPGGFKVSPCTRSSRIRRDMCTAWIHVNRRTR
jgi:hypothetical protein